MIFKTCLYVVASILATTPINSLADPTTAPGKVDMSGDFRIRYETNSAAGTSPSWDRGVVRGRLAATYQLNNSIQLGTRLVTGDPDNPRTADTTLNDFDGDLDISLDQAYVAYRNRRLFLVAGKFAKPFASTELAWDGDVNPQGLAAQYEFVETDTWSAHATGIYFLINENIFEGDSSMLGAQLSMAVRPSENWSIGLHGAYYDYEIGNLSPDAPGNARGNNLDPGGTTLLSDFDLIDIVASVSYSGFGERWNVGVVSNYVRNLGASVEEDVGYGTDLFLGNLDETGRWKLRYGYSRAETDAILGMFSQDNIEIPTNYELHALSLDYALLEHTFVGLTNYRYRYLDPQPGALFADDWVSRTRLNLYFRF